MSLKEQIKQDLIKYMKERDKLKTTAIRTLNAEIKNEEIKNKKELDNQEIITVVSRLIKQYNESLEYAKNDKDKEKEISLIISTYRTYLPKQLSKEEVKNIILSTIEENNITSEKQKGLVMKNIMTKIKGKYDGSKINILVEEILKTI